MRTRGSLLSGFVCTAAAVLVGAAPAAAIGGGTPLTIDAFSTGQPTLMLTFPPAGSAAGSSLSGGGILGSERDILVNLDAGVIAGNSISSGVASGFLSHSQDATITGASTVSWDGSDASISLDPTGLGGVDLTAGGTQDALDLSVAFDDLPANATITVHTDAANASAATFVTPGLLFSATHFVVPFSVLTPTLGTGADVTNVGAIQLRLGSATTAPDVVVDALTTDALLRAPMTAALTSDANANTMADPGDEVTYTTTVSNPDDQFDAAASATAFALTPGAGSALVAGSVTTTQGTVTTGNGGSDSSVAVAIGGLADGASATITATVRVLAGASDPLSAQGTVTSDSLSALRTDDPGVGGTADPTEVAVVTNTPPVAVADSYDAVGGATLSVPAAGVLTNDTDTDGDVLTADLVSTTTHGTLALNADGSFTYAPGEDTIGTDSFSYRAHDASAYSDPVTVTITVQAGCDGHPATIIGTSGGDRLRGTGGDDVIVGLGGNDTIEPGSGDDIVCGGSGNDTISTGSGNDSAHGDSGNDTIAGGSGSDTLHGDAGNDSIDGGGDNDQLYGDSGIDQLFGGGDDDHLDGGPGSPDSCNGEGGTDTATACETVTRIP